MKRGSSGAEILFAVGLVALVLAFGIWVKVSRYRECRAVGFSPFYCFWDR